MIGKQIKGTGFRGCLNYVLGKKDADLIGGTMCGQTPEELAAEFAIARQLRPNLKVAVFHATLSVDSTQKLEVDVDNDQRWLAIAANYMKAMEFDNNQYAVVKHSDTNHDHIHIVASRIRLDGSVVDDSWDYYKSQEVIRQLERDYNLEAVTPSWETYKRAPTTGEHRYLQSKGNKSVRVQLQDLIDEVTQDKPTMPEFVEGLQQQGVEVQVKTTQSELSQGISYKIDGVAFSGSQLGKAYTFSGLQKHRGVSYDQGRDNALIEALMQPQHLAIVRGEAQTIELESLQSEVEATVPKILATANELELPQSEIEVTVPVIPATPNKLELQLSMLPEQKSQKQQKQEEHKPHQLWADEIAPIVLALLDSYQADSLESNNKRYQIDRFPETCDVVVQRVDTLEPVPNCTQVLGFNYSKKELKVWHNLLTQEDVEHFQAVDQQLLDKQQQLQQQQTPQQQILEAQQENLQNRTIAEEIVPIAGAALEHTLLTTKTPAPAIDWNQYRISWNRQELELSITVSDGRGEILTASFENDGTYQLPACSVTPEDVKNFQTLRQELQEQLPYKVPQPQKSLSNQLQRQPPSRKQIELD